jgi:RNA binding exosome subunit
LTRNKKKKAPQDDMKLLHNLLLTVYAKPEDDGKKVKENIRKFFPFDLKEEKIKINQKTATGFEERKIRIFTVELEKQRHLNKFIKHLREVLREDQKELLRKQKRSRIDQNNHFFIRFDKDKLITQDEFWITDAGNCYHLKLSIAAFPTSRENALKTIDDLFKKAS